MEQLSNLTGKIMGLPPVASAHGAEVDHLIIYVHWLMAALFIGWIIYFGIALIKFRRGANPKADYTGIRGHASSYVEGLVALVEAVLLIGFAVPLWANAVDHFPTGAEKPLRLKIVAQQFAWNVFYPGPDGEFGRQDLSLVSSDNPWGLDKTDPKGKDDFTTLDQVHVPVNCPVIITLTSKDVIHSFKIIAMRVTQDAIPGVAIPLHFTPTQIGVYQINCAQLCGVGHYGMANGRLHVDSEADYAKWLATQTKTAASPQSFE